MNEKQNSELKIRDNRISSLENKLKNEINKNNISIKSYKLEIQD